MKTPAASSSGRATAQVLDELKRMIFSGELLPGQQIRQETMAERLGVSRLPIRESLRQLTSDGLVQHVPNVGYSVARLDQSELEQIYLMRSVLERETLRALPTIDAEAVDRIEELGEKVKAAAEVRDFLGMRLCNQDFHFAIFEQSG
ncbi:GntR family transcriptional regulator, partial [Rhodococcus hoagii]|nr:GntR family transcriptional regulator [Prescottella equi]